MNDLDKHTFPPGGWMFRQPQTGWSAPTPTSSTFSQTAQLILQHRAKNQAVTVRHNLSLDLNRIEDELLNFNRARLGIPQPQPQSSPSFFQPARNFPSHVAAAAAGIKRAAQGTAVPLDWFQAGGDPVAQELAERRAAICVQCPKNVQGAWYTEAPAEILKAAIIGWQALKGNSFKFETSQGDKLKSCDVCKCLMRLKVFTPLGHILDRTKPEIMAEFPPNCWIARKDQ